MSRTDFCGPKAKPLLSWFIPDWFPSTGYIGCCCALHDFLYALGGDEKQRRRADRLLGRCIRCKAEHRGKTFWGKITLRRRRGRAVALLYLKAVRARSGEYFNYRPPRSTF